MNCCKIWAQKWNFGSNLTEFVSDIWSTMCVQMMDVHVPLKCMNLDEKLQFQARKFSSLKFEQVFGMCIGMEEHISLLSYEAIPPLDYEELEINTNLKLVL